MEDSQILSLYFARSEQAIAETDRKYGGYCYHIAYNILTNSQDAEESVSDTYLAAWNAIPPKTPCGFGCISREDHPFSLHQPLAKERRRKTGRR